MRNTSDRFRIEHRRVDGSTRDLAADKSQSRAEVAAATWAQQLRSSGEAGRVVVVHVETGMVMVVIALTNDDL